MSMYIIISPRAEKSLHKIPKFDQIAIAKRIRSLVNHKNVPADEKLQSYNDIFRFRLGNYRVVYKKSSKLIYIVLIAHRKDIYRLLRDFFK